MVAETVRAETVFVVMEAVCIGIDPIAITLGVITLVEASYVFPVYATEDTVVADTLKAMMESVELKIKSGEVIVVAEIARAFIVVADIEGVPDIPPVNSICPLIERDEAPARTPSIIKIELVGSSVIILEAAVPDRTRGR